MKLHEYLSGLTKTARAAFADRCGTSANYLFQVGYGNRKPKAGLVVAIERESNGVVRCEDVQPDVDWAYLRSSARGAIPGDRRVGERRAVQPRRAERRDGDRRGRQ